MFFAANGAAFGVRSTLGANFGYHVATFSVTVAIGLGFSVVLLEVPQVFLAIKWIGAAYVFWIAYRMFNAGTAGSGTNAHAATFWDGVILLLFNPKAYVIIVLMFSQFLTDQSARAVLYISAIFTLNNMIAFLVWTMVGDMLLRHFRSEKQSHVINRGFGLMLGAVAIWMAVV